MHAAGGADLTGGGTHIYINAGSGSFYYLPICNIPVVDNEDILGFGSFAGSHPPERSFPINIDKAYGMDFITYKQLPREYASDEPDHLFLFTLESTTVIHAASVDGSNVATECP